MNRYIIEVNEKNPDFVINYNKEVKKTDLFYDEYVHAFSNLNDIIQSNQLTKNNFSTYEEMNNIIALCGDRGQGKTTVMNTFKAIVENIKNEKIKHDFIIPVAVKSSRFLCMEVIDPSRFEKFRDILDILLSKIYLEFKDISENPNNNTEKKLLDKMKNTLNKTYKSVSLLKNEEKFLDSEFDIDYSLTKLSQISEIINVKKNFDELLDSYIELKLGNEENNYLILFIDDLDLNSKSAYKMSEQIRKYLLNKKVIVVIALKIEQLHYAVEREFIKDYELSLKYDVFTESETSKMANNYLDKLILEQRRIFLPDIDKLVMHNNIQIRNTENLKIHEDLNKYLLNLIFIKTGMMFYEGEVANVFLPKTIREITSLIALLNKMKNYDIEKDVENDYKTATRLSNITKFENYFLRNWIYDHLNGYECGIINNLSNKDNNQLLKEMYKYIYKGKKEKISIGDIYSIIFDNEIQITKNEIKNETVFVNSLLILLTIKLNYFISLSKSKISSLFNFLGKVYMTKNLQNLLIRKHKGSSRYEFPVLECTDLNNKYQNALLQKENNGDFDINLSLKINEDYNNGNNYKFSLDGLFYVSLLKGSKNMEVFKHVFLNPILLRYLFSKNASDNFDKFISKFESLNTELNDVFNLNETLELASVKEIYDIFFNQITVFDGGIKTETEITYFNKKINKNFYKFLEDVKQGKYIGENEKDLSVTSHYKTIMNTFSTLILKYESLPEEDLEKYYKYFVELINRNIKVDKEMKNAYIKELNLLLEGI